MSAKYKLEPDYAVAPGATLKETIEARGISQAELASRMGMSEKTISQIVNGVAPITYETAERLELVLGIPAHFWNRRELTYRQAIARAEVAARLNQDIAWLDKIPVRVLKDRGFIADVTEKSELVRLSLAFFGVSSVEAWQETWADPIAQYRGKAVQEKKPGFVAAWLRMGEVQAASIAAEPFNAGLFREALQQLRGMTTEAARVWSKAMQDLCAKAGVAVVFTKEIPGAGVSGATRWLTKDKALIQLSLKYKTDDQFWFTFFHEAGHILLHGKRQVFVEFGLTTKSIEEEEANRFARTQLIPDGIAHHLPALRDRTKIRLFAKKCGVAPGIVVGRLQHDGIVYRSAFNDLKRKMTWTS